MRSFLLLALASTALAQPAFDVASVKEVLDFQPNMMSEKVILHPGSLTMQSVRLRTALKWAYDLKEYQIAGPAWMGVPGWRGHDVARYDILAKAKDGTPEAEMKPMLRRLLAERFKLVTHQETREISAMILTFAKATPNVKASADQNAEKRVVPEADGVRFLNLTMAEFVEFLSGPVQTPVLDRTGLEGRYDITMKNPSGESPNEQLAAIPAAVNQQLGLKLERQKAPVEMLIVDSGEKKPIEN